MSDTGHLISLPRYFATSLLKISIRSNAFSNRMVHRECIRLVPLVQRKWMGVNDINILPDQLMNIL